MQQNDVNFGPIFYPKVNKIPLAVPAVLVGFLETLESRKPSTSSVPSVVRGAQYPESSVTSTLTTAGSMLSVLTRRSPGLTKHSLLFHHYYIAFTWLHWHTWRPGRLVSWWRWHGCHWEWWWSCWCWHGERNSGQKNGGPSSQGTEKLVSWGVMSRVTSV